MRPIQSVRTRNVKRFAFITVLILTLIVGVGLSAVAYDNASAQNESRVDPPDIPLRVMVPHPEVAAQMEADGETLLTRFPNMDPERTFSFGPKMNLFTGRAAPPTPFRTLAIMVEFTDNPATAPASYFDTLLFDNSTPYTMRSYYLEASYGVLDIITVNLPSTLGWQMAPQTYAYYVDGAHCTGTYPNNCQRLTEDLVALIDPVVDFSVYDNDGDNWVDTVFVIHAGPGAEANFGDPDMIWSHSWETLNPPNPDGVWVGSYTTEPEYDSVVSALASDMTHGVFAHELGHAFGLPDFYDTDYSSMGIRLYRD